MYILRVITSMDPAGGGPSLGIRNSIAALTKLGVHNEVVCLDAATASFLGQDNFPIHAIGPSTSLWAYNRSLIPWLLANFKRFDVVIAHGLWQYQTHAVSQALKKYKPGKGHQ